MGVEFNRRGKGFTMTGSHQAFAEPIDKEHFGGNPRASMDFDDLVPFSMPDGMLRPRPGSFYAIVAMAFASWLVIGGIALIISQII